MGDVTSILDGDSPDDPMSADDLLTAVYDELRRLAASKMGNERPDNTLQATALVHEAWLKISKSKQDGWKNRSHFFAAAAEAMRRILIDRARKRQVRERAGLSHKEPLEESQIVLAAPPGEILDIHESLDALERESPEAATLVKLRYFVGMTMPECSEAMDLSLRKVERIWSFARSWLRTDLEEKLT